MVERRASPTEVAAEEIVELLFGSAGTVSGAHRYAIADAAQEPRLPGVLRAPLSRCLMGDDDSVQQASPHLVELPDDRQAKLTWRWIATDAPKTPCLTLLTSTLDFDAMYDHLQSFLDVRVNAKTTMVLAYWDPMILAALLGQPGNTTLHVKGPVFNSAQRNRFALPLQAVCYWDRRGQLRRINPASLESDVPAEQAQGSDPVLPLVFQPEQVQRLVEAGLPDRVLYELRLNRPEVLAERSDWENYGLTCRLVNAAHELNIRGLRDLVNFVGTGMVLGEQFHRFPPIADVLGAVREKKQTFTEVLAEFPEDVLQHAQDACGSLSL